jgi:hypothetical protein
MPHGADEEFRVTDRRRRDTAEESAPAAAGQAQAVERSLEGLFMMLAAEAVIALGDAPDPSTGRPRRELPHAAAIIDLLALLREKTDGHRSAAETRVLDDVIYDLQLRYVRASKSPEG